MADKPLLDYAYAIQAISQSKSWAANKPMGKLWRPVSGGRVPTLFEIYVALEISGAVRKGWWVKVSYQRSPRGFHPDNFSASLLIDNARVLAFDSGKPTGHRNRVGIGEPYYLKRVDHPHWHRPVHEASEGYVEPLDPLLTHAALWQMFLERANIERAPNFQKPPWEQGDLL